MNYGDYLTSGGVKVSSANQDIIEPSPQDWSVGYTLRKISFINVEDCTVIFTTHNDKNTEVELPAGVGLEFDYGDPPVKSLVIKEAGIPYLFIATY